MTLSPQLFEVFMQRLNDFTPVSIVLELKLRDIIFIESHKMGSRILNEREIQKKFWFIIKGSARAFRENNQLAVSEQTFWYWFDEEFVFTLEFFSQVPSAGSIEMLENSILAYIVSDDLFRLKKSSDEADKLIEAIRYHYEQQLSTHLEDVQKLNARERYLKLHNKHPKLFNYSKQKDIASFLRMNQDTLSKVKNIR